MVEAGPPRSAVHPPQQHSVHQTQSAHTPQSVGQGGGLQPQRSFSSSEEERSTPECASDEPDESEKGESMLDILANSFFFTNGTNKNEFENETANFNLASLRISELAEPSRSVSS